VSTTKVVLVVEYNGTNYFGFQWQAGSPTVQGEIEAAVKRLTGEELRVIAASRTDTGVHARGQVVSFRTGSELSEDAFVGGLNYHLPGDIAIRAAHRVNDSFDVRRDAFSREYSYCIWNSRVRSPLLAGRAFQVVSPLDTASANLACASLVGEHDFASFTTGDGTGLKTTVRRVIRAGMEREGDQITFDIEANSFLPHQVRNTVGALVRVGTGKMSVAEFKSIMDAREPGAAGPTAPACGLCLNKVNYPGPLGEK
jgi:tRNA pseudouridine38-40 synthase